MPNKFKYLAIKALDNSNTKNVITESRITYEAGHPERMDSVLTTQLRERRTSLGNHPIFPESDETHFEEKLMSQRFKDVLKTFKRHHGVEKIDIDVLQADQFELFHKILNLEIKHKEELEKLAINLVREEFKMGEADVEIVATLTTDLKINQDTSKLKINPKTDVVFDNHSELSQANKEVYKRRFINAMIQGSAKKTNHMFHVIDEELQELEPLLPSSYSKLMSGADYAYMVYDDTKPRMIGGAVHVEFPKSDGQRPKIVAEAMTLPVLIHEIVKGVMEILSAHGLPENPEVAKYVIDKADFMAAESWDMRIGPPIWEKIMETIPSEDFHLKHHVYVELVALPVDEFNDTMREILMGSRTGKAKIEEILKEVKDDLRNDEFDNAMDKISDDEFFDSNDLDNIDDEDWFM
jgi:hypothetical protein